MTHLYINAITPPPEVQKAIDDRSRMGVFKDMEKLMQMKAAMAMEKSSESEGGASSGMGTSLGLMLLVFFAFSRQGSANYHFAVIGILCAAVAVSRADQIAKPTPAPAIGS